MTPLLLWDLLMPLCVSIPAAWASWAVHRGLVSSLRFRPSSRLSEPPLWGWGEMVLCVAFWQLVQLCVGATLWTVVPAVGRAGVFALSQLLASILTAGLGVQLIRDRLGQPLSALGLVPTSRRNWLPTLAFWPLSWFPLKLAHLGWILVLQTLVGHEPEAQAMVSLFQGLVDDGDWISVGSLVASGVVVAPLIEEAIFRGFLFGALRTRWGPILAALASSAIFAAVHYSLSALLPLFLLGCLLSYLYARTGSLYPPMLFHSLFNLATYATILYQCLLT